MRALYVLLACMAGIFSASIASAQNYPSRPITIVVPFPAGGPTDAIARIMAEQLKASLGQTVVVENIGGGGGTIAIGRVVRAAPDGYTLGIGHWGTHVVAGAVYPIPHDFLKDQEIADVLTYVRSSFGNKASAVSAGEVKAQRAALKK